MLYLRFASYVRDGCCVHANSRDADFSWLKVMCGFTIGASRHASRLLANEGRFAQRVRSTIPVLLALSIRSAAGDLPATLDVYLVASRTFDDAWNDEKYEGDQRYAREEKRDWNATVQRSMPLMQSSFTCIGMLCFKILNHRLSPWFDYRSRDYADFRSRLDFDRQSDSRAFRFSILNLAADLMLHFLPRD